MTSQERAEAIKLLEDPCMWCDYNGEGYWQSGTHTPDCDWYTVGGLEERLTKLAQEG